MKRFFGIMVFSACVLLVSSFTWAGASQNAKSAIGNGKQPAPATTFRGPNYVDRNHDGVCDNFRGGRRAYRRFRAGRQFRGAQNAGRAVNAAGMQRGRFVEKNGDGVCDNAVPAPPEK